MEENPCGPLTSVCMCTYLYVEVYKQEHIHMHISHTGTYMCTRVCSYTITGIITWDKLKFCSLVIRFQSDPNGSILLKTKQTNPRNLGLVMVSFLLFDQYYSFPLPFQTSEEST